MRPDSTPQIVPIGFRYDTEQDVIYIGGQYLSQSKKFRNIPHDPQISLVIDDVLTPWQPRGVEIQEIANTVETGGNAFLAPIIQPIRR